MQRGKSSRDDSKWGSERPPRERESIPEGVEETNNALPILSGLKFTFGVQFVGSRAVGVVVLMQVFPVLFFHQVDQVYASAICLPPQ